MSERTESLPAKEGLTINWGALLQYGTLLLILGFHVWGSLYWIQRNVTLVGRDAGGHLTRALQYADVLYPWRLQSLFDAITYHQFRPPALYLAVQIPYGLWGTSSDAAQMLNIFFLITMLGLTYIIGRRITTASAALFAVLLTGLFPMTAAMARLFYLEHFQTTMVLLALLGLMASAGFTQRGWALLWGLSIGLGLLVKWSMPAYLVLPSLMAMWAAGLFGAQWEALRRFKIDWQTLARSLLLAGGLVALWYLPNRERALTLPLGDWVALIWLLLLVPACYALQRPSRPLTNFWAGALLGLALASLWYIPRIDFLSLFIDSAFGTYGGNYAAWDPRRVENYIRNPRYLVTHHLGILGALLILPVGFWPWLQQLGRHWHQVVARAREVGPLPPVWLLWAVIFSTYILTSFTSQDGERNLAAILPILAILWAEGLRRYRRGLAQGLAVAWVAVLGVQWALYTFDGLNDFHQRTAALWARGEFLQRPATGIADPGFWIAPDVLATIQAHHDPSVGPQSILGMLVNAIEIHRGPFNYLIKSNYPTIDLITLTEIENQDAWARTLRSEWVLTKDGDNHDVDPPGRRAIAEVYENPDGLFARLFQEVQRYPLPNGETATLWRRTIGPRYLPRAPETLTPLGETLRAWLGTAPLVLSDETQALTIGLLDVMPAQVALLDELGPEPGDELGNELGNEAPLQAPTLFVLLHRGQGLDTPTMAALQTDYYPAYDGWFDSEFLMIWGRPGGPMPTHPTPHRFGAAQLETTSTVAEVQVGQVLPIAFQWAALPATPLKASVRLVTPTGESVAQLDRDLQPGMRLGLFVPPNTPPGPYQLVLSVYDPATITPIQDEQGQALTPLGAVTISP